MARSYSAESLVSVHVVVTGPTLTFGAIPHVAALPLANGAWLDVQQGTDLGRGLAGFDQFLGLSADVQGERRHGGMLPEPVERYKIPVP